MVQTLCLHTPEMSWMFHSSASELWLHRQGQLHPIEVHFYLQTDLIPDNVANLLSLQFAACYLLIELVEWHGSHERGIDPDPHVLFDKKCTASRIVHSHS